MNNFGVIEVASTKTKNAPGWAYVPDIGPSPAAAALQPTNRKRAVRNQTALSLSDVSARQDTKVRKDLEALDRDIHRDANIPIPPKPGAGRAQNKHTPNVRKILQSQKTFANHLDDYQALLTLAETNPAAAAALANAAPTKPAVPSTSARNSPAPTASGGGGGGSSGGGGGGSKRSAALAKRAALVTAKEQKEAAAAKKAAKVKSEPVFEAEHNTTSGNNDGGDVEMTDAPPTSGPGEGAAEVASKTTPSGSATPTAAAVSSGSSEPQLQPVLPPPPETWYQADGSMLPAYKRKPPVAHPGDNDPLLVSSRVPRFPTDDELCALMTAPPLSYLEARAGWGDEEGRYPVRTFCEVCGYWGRVRCLKCGARACALDCLQTHKEECFTRYGL
ncbi:hypothetical protein B0H66DRAFT_32292 [Apodospora peruviana]|uniref:HIT-type domain-containing protein n=1 Tax=Apodospora peruviana TaxID=516989 RepID=A0AAE0IR51_9PEZI|nr:hypothetical protein B0H66DRAFT_32292 [Apodospora peruviana]